MINNDAGDNLYARYFQSLIFISALILFGGHALVFIAWPGSEAADKTTFILVLLLTVLFCGLGGRIEKLDIKYNFFSPAINIVLTLLVLGLLGSKNILPGYLDYSLWWGYGWEVAVLSLFGMVVSYFFPHQIRRIILFLSSYKISINSCFYILIACYLISLFTPPLALLNGPHSNYVISEIMGPGQNKFPSVNFFSQYTQTFGYVFDIFGFKTETQAIYFLELFKFISVGFIAYIFWLIEKSVWKIAFVLFLGFSFGTKGYYADSVDSGSIAFLHSALPVRTFGPIINFLALHYFLKSERSVLGAILLGLSLAVGLLINIEIGSAAGAATLLVLLIRWPTLKVFVYISLSFLLCLLLQLFLIRYIAGESPHLPSFFAFIGGFSAGYGAVPMPVFGLWVAIFSLTAALVAYGFRGLTEGYERSTIYLYFGALTLIALPYYINRSVNSGQLQLIILYLGIPLSLYLSRYISSWLRGVIDSSVNTALVLLLFWFSFFTNVNMPHPHVEAVRLVFGFQSIDSNPQLKEDSSLLAAEVRDKTGLILSFSNIMAARFDGYTSLARLNNEGDVQITGKDFYLCDPATSPLDRVIVSLTIDSVRAQVASELKKCGFEKIWDGNSNFKYAQSWGRIASPHTGNK